MVNAANFAFAGDTPAELLPDQIDQPMRQRLQSALARLELRGDATVRSTRILRDNQVPVLDAFAEFLRDLTTSDEEQTPYGRIIQPPRTGKTVIAGEVIARTGLTATFITNTRNLVEQAERDFRAHLPGTLIGVYYGDRKEVVPFGVNVTTYDMMNARWKAGTVPPAIRTSGIVFADEAHHSMTLNRQSFLADAFDSVAIRLALTATPNYSDRRALSKFFPTLIHELSLQEAVTLDLLAPLRVWVADVDVDASSVRVIDGDFQEDELGRIMSAGPFLEAVKHYRYADENRRLPAVLTCASRQQAYDLHRYLRHHHPKFMSPPELVLGETEDRDKILERFELGVTDTLICVNVLIEGWNSPRCKLLIDLAPSVSMVRSTQKFCRVLTKQEDQEARIYMILPKGLSKAPIMPMEILMTSSREYEAGDLVSDAKPSPARQAPKIKRVVRTPIKEVTLKTSIVLTQRVEKPKLEPKNREQVRSVLREAGLHLEFPRPLSQFRAVVFRHDLFTGRADHLLRYLGYRPNKDSYRQFLTKFCPEGMATLLLSEGQASKQAEPTDREQALDAWLSLGGRDPVPLLEELVDRMREIRRLREQVAKLPSRECYILTKCYGLDGMDETQAELARRFGTSPSRIGQIRQRVERQLCWLLRD
jgi:superfamily II DNA or RNA helicase